MLHSTKLLNKILITLMALLLLFNTNYGAFKTSEAHANALTATFEEWAAASYAGVVMGTMALATGAMHTEEYLLDNVDAMYQTAKESWKTMAPDMKANFLSSIDQMEDGIVTVGDWITTALDSLKSYFSTDGPPAELIVAGNGFVKTNDIQGTMGVGNSVSGTIQIALDEINNKSIFIGGYTYWRLTVMTTDAATGYYNIVLSNSAGRQRDISGYTKDLSRLVSTLSSANSVPSIHSALNAIYTYQRNTDPLVLQYGSVAVGNPVTNPTYSRLDDWIRERAIPNGQLGVYNPGAQAYTPDGYRLGLSTDGQTLLKLPDGIPWEGTADWKQPLLNTVDGTTAVLDTVIGSWIDVATGKKIRDATVPEMASGTGVDESTAEYVLIRAKDEEKDREEKDTEKGEYAGKAYEGNRNPDVDFRNGKGKSTLDDHAENHGYVSSERYLQNARNFLEKPPTSTTETFVSKEGTYFRYDSATNEFGIINKYGGISTYFKPDDKLLYWLDQIKKYAPK